MKLSIALASQAQLHSCMIPSAGWPAYVKTQAGKLLKELGVSSETIMHPELLKLVMYRQYGDQANVADGLANTAATMVIVLPSQFKVYCLSRLTVADYALSCQAHWFMYHPSVYRSCCIVCCSSDPLLCLSRSPLRHETTQQTKNVCVLARCCIWHMKHDT